MTIDDAARFLSFDDWLRGPDYQRADWIVVAQSCDDGDTHWAMQSALMPPSEGALDRLFAKPTWELREYIGHPSLEQSGSHWTFDEGRSPVGSVRRRDITRA